MRRREFITLLGGAAATWPLAARAQQQKRVGVLMNGVETDQPYQANAVAFVQQLRRLGWIDGQNLHIEYRWNGSDAALAAGVSAAAAPVRSADQLEPTIANVARQPNGGIIFPTDSFMNVHRRAVIDATARYRIPAIYSNEVTRDGGLMYYVTVYEDQ